MILADKIIYLRKKAGYSQEDLASELNVSRQSISKWEGALSIPEMDKIIKLSEVFSVSTDFLLKEDIVAIDDNSIIEDKDVRTISLEEANTFLSDNTLIAKRIATAVTLFIFSPITIFIAYYLVENNLVSEKIGYGISMSLLLLIVAVGVLILISSSPLFDKYKYLEKEEVNLMYGVSGVISKKRDENIQRLYVNIGIGVLLCIVSIIPLFMFDEAFVGSDAIGMIILLSLVGFGVCLIIYNATQIEGYNKLMQEYDYTKSRKHSVKIIEAIAGPYWLIITAVYLASSFITNAWGSTWIIWPVAALFFAAISALVQSLYGKNNY